MTNVYIRLFPIIFFNGYINNNISRCIIRNISGYPFIVNVLSRNIYIINRIYIGKVENARYYFMII